MNKIISWRALGVLCAGITAVACGDDATETKNSTITNAEGNAPTWHQDIAPLVIEKCSGCHTEGGIAPFSVKDYASAKVWAGAMADAVEAGRMPPFLAQETDECQPKQKWKDDIRLNDEQKKLLRAWADAKAPEGDASKAATVVEPMPVNLEREDIQVKLPHEVTIDGTKDLHKCYLLDPQITDEGLYGVGSQVTSGNDKVLHHVVSYIIPPPDKADKTKMTKAELIAALKAEKGVGVGEAYDCFAGPNVTSATAQILNAWAPAVCRYLRRRTRVSRCPRTRWWSSTFTTIRSGHLRKTVRPSWLS